MGPETQDEPREQAAAARDQPSAEAPVDDAAALRVARSDDEVRLAVTHRGDEADQARRVVRPVRIHLDHDRGAAAERDAEAIEVRPAEALLRGAVADPDPRVGRREPSASSPVPSGDPSSTTRSVQPGSDSRIAAAIPGRLSASLYVGRTTHVPVPTPSGAAGGVRPVESVIVIRV